MKKSLVTVEWLHQNINNPNLIVLDATMKKATYSNNIALDKQIKNARFIDIKNSFSEVTAQFPNTMLTVSKFQERAQLLGINNDSIIIVYDNIGVYSSPRVWWMFKSMGHHNIAVLNGGLIAWKKAGFVIESKKEFKGNKGNFIANYNPTYFCNYNNVLNSISDKATSIIDARSEDRFNGTKEEPRKGLRAGHIPSSQNLPYTELQLNGKMKSEEELKTLFNLRIKNEKKYIFSCGSGITACILALGAEIAGLKNSSIYDGSWTEWGNLKELPIQ